MAAYIPVPHRRLPVTVAVLLLAGAPLSALQGQTAQDSAAKSTWGVNPGARRPTQAPTPTATTPATPVPGVTSAVADSAFIRQAIAGNLLEVRLGTLAGQRASSAEVRKFGQRMVTEHGNMGRQWSEVASKNGLPASGTLDPVQQQSVTRLAALAGAEFDRAYMNDMVQDHQQDVATFQRLGPAAHSGDVRSFAASGVSVMQQHLVLAQQVAAQVGAPTTVATAPTVPTTPTTVPTTPQPQPGQVGVPPAGQRSPNDRADKNANEIRTDAKYIREVAAGHIMELRLAERAQEQSKDPKVRQLAKQMASHFSEWQKRWTNVAENNGININSNLGPLHREKVDRLEKAGPRQLDRVYLDIVTENLASMVPYFQKEGRAARSARVRNLVQDELPALQQLLADARRLERQDRADAKSAKDRAVSTNK